MFTLYAETAFQVKPSAPASVVSLPIPSQDGSYRRSKYSSRSGGHGDTYPKDEKEFVKQCLANQGSVYFRQAKQYPRSFVWRVVEDSYVLQLQCADFSRSKDASKEADLTLSFEFQSPILPSGVALSDADIGSTLYLFVITAKKEFHALSIPTKFFYDAEASKIDLRQWCETLVPSAFTIDHPHQLYAHTPFNLFISFDSGRLLRLHKPAENSDWQQENYDDRTWGASIRGIVSRRGPGPIPYGSRLLDPSAAHAMVADSIHIYTVCLNHTLRVWNTESGKLVLTKDLLDKPRQPHDHVQLSPAEPSCIRLYKQDLMRYPVLVTFSPQDGGQFKFWDVKGGRTDAVVIEDKFPSAALSPPDPDPSGNTVWSMTGFEVVPGSQQHKAALWVLWQNNNYHQLYSVDFDMASIPTSWKNSWVKAFTASSTKGSAPDLVKFDAADPSQKWLEYIFQPDRYPPPVLETALSIFQEAVSSRESSSRKGKSLQERLCSLIATNVSLRKYGDSDMDYERFCSDTDQQWRNYWRIVETVDEGRHAPLSFSLDIFAGIGWVSMADQCSFVRECSKVELLMHNDGQNFQSLDRVAAGRWPHRNVGLDTDEPLERLSTLINAAAEFRTAFSPELAQDIHTAIDEEIFEDSDDPVPLRIRDFYDRVNFAEAISNETFEQLELSLSKVGGLSSLSPELFLTILTSVISPITSPEGLLCNTFFGSAAISAGLQGMVTLRKQLMLDMLCLAVFLQVELSDDEAKNVDFDVSAPFDRLIRQLRKYETLSWLAFHTRQASLPRSDVEPAQGSGAIASGRPTTILADVVVRDTTPWPVEEVPQSYLLNHMLDRALSFIDDDDDFSSDSNATYVQCYLLTRNEITLASDFLAFQPRTAWSAYVKGRLYLARSEPDTAARFFQRASYALACGKAVGHLRKLSAGLLSNIDIHNFNNGLPRYLQHILALFESAGAFSQCADFAKLALQALSPGPTEPVPNFKSEILARLFTAELKCARFSAAFDALSQFSDEALQKSSVIALVAAILEASSLSNMGSRSTVRVLQSLPIGLHPHLARHVDEYLSSRARTQSSIPGTRSPWSSTGAVDYLQILHTMRVSQGDYRGAVSVLFDRLRLIRKSSRARNDPQGAELRQALLALINAMTCVAPDEAYILTDMEDQPRGQITSLETEEAPRKKRRRLIITMEDLRREYQHLLDRCSRIERGDFDFDLGGSSDEEAEDEEAVGRLANGETMEMG